MPPKFLSDEAKREWKRAVPILYSARLLTELDVPLFTLYCVAWGQYVEAQEKRQFHGPIIIGPGGFPDSSPFVALGNKAFEQVMRTLVEFGMSPSSRTRVSGGMPILDPNNPVSRFFEEHQGAASNPAAKWFKE